MNEYINLQLYKSWWINGLQQQVFIRKQAFPELMLFLTELEDDNCRMSVPGVSEMVTLFRKMNYLISYGQNLCIFQYLYFLI